MTRRLLAGETIVGLALLSRRVRSTLCGVGDAVDEPPEAVAERGSGIIRRSYRVLVVTHAKDPTAGVAGAKAGKPQSFATVQGRSSRRTSSVRERTPSLR